MTNREYDSALDAMRAMAECQERPREPVPRPRPCCYLASSWSNPRHPEILAALRSAGLDVYDYRDPGFSFDSIDRAWREWSVSDALAAYRHPLAVAAWHADRAALDRADLCVALKPGGWSTAAEASYVRVRGRPLFILNTASPYRPDLLDNLADGIFDSVGELLADLRRRLDGNMSFKEWDRWEPLLKLYYAPDFGSP